MKTYVTDTHSLLWAFTRPAKLGKRARRAFEDIASGKANLLVPVIVLAELIFTVENKPISADLDEIIQKLEASSNIQFVPLDEQTILRLRDLTAIPEMHDRMIAAEAAWRGAALITFDNTITVSGLVEVVW